MVFPSKFTRPITLAALCAICLVTVFIGGNIYKLYQFKHTTMDVRLSEISGIEFDKSKRLWAINDGGDKAHLYRVKSDGSIDKTIEITNAKNLDWEDMTQDDFGHFFIGDFGNNNIARNWLTVYKIENPIDIKSNETFAEIIKFSYPKSLNNTLSQEGAAQDLEAFVYYKKKLYLFTKNRTEPFDGKTHLLSIGDHAANYHAQYIDSFTTCTSFKMSCWVTSAALSPDRTKLVLLDSKRLWLFEHWHDDNFFSGDIYEIDLGIITQKESVTFYDNNHLVFTDEEFKGIGRNAYVINLAQTVRTKVKSRDEHD